MLNPADCTSMTQIRAEVDRLDETLVRLFAEGGGNGATGISYVCPVLGTKQVLAKTNPAAAKDPLIFPTEEMRARLHEFVSQLPEERAAWEAAFQEAVGL